MIQVENRPSPNHDARPDTPGIDMIVIHYTGMESAEAALDRLCDPAAKVSAHYLIEEDGRAWQLVDEEQRAWHAGVSMWRGETDTNGRSIGIELVNPGHEFGYRPFPEPQMAVLTELLSDVITRHGILARHIVGHSDVAPARKTDPGELFDWARLAAAGIGVWPNSDGASTPANGASMLKEIGYDVSDMAATVAAFQRHYRPSKIDGQLDDETLTLVAALHKQVANSDGHS